MSNVRDKGFKDDCMKLLGKIEESLPIHDNEMQKELGILLNLISKIKLYGNETQLANAKIAYKASITGAENNMQLEIIQSINRALGKDIDRNLYTFRSHYNVGVIFVAGIFFLSSVVIFFFRFLPEIYKPASEIFGINLVSAAIFAAFFSAACGHLVKSSNDSFINRQIVLKRPYSIIRGAIQTLSTALIGVFVSSLLLISIIKQAPDSKAIGMWLAWIYILLAGFSGWFIMVLKHDIFSIFKRDRKSLTEKQK